MEPNTSCPSAAGTFPAIVHQGLNSPYAHSLVPPPSFIPQPPAGHVSASSFASGSPPAGVGFLSVHGNATLQYLPSSSFSFPEVHTTGGDMFAQPEAPAAAAFPTPLVWEGLVQPSSTWTASSMLEFPSAAEGFSGFAGQSAALEQMAVWQGDMSSLFSPPSGSGPPPRSSGSGVGSAAPPSSDYELVPLPESLRIPPPEEASKYNTISETFMDVGSSIPSVSDLTMAAMTLSQGAGASSNFSGFGQLPSNSDEVAPFPASLQAPLLPVKQEPIHSTATVSRDPEFISLIDDEEAAQDQDVIPHSMPDAEALSVQETVLKEPDNVRSSAMVAGSSSSMNTNSSSSTAKLSIGAKKSSSSSRQLFHLPPSPLRAGASSSRNYYTRIVFTDAEKETISKDKNLQELLNTDPKKQRRILSNRAYTAMRKTSRDTQTLEQKREVEKMQINCNTLRGHLQLLQWRCAEMEEEEKKMIRMVQEREQQLMMKYAVGLQSHLQTLNFIKLRNALQTNPEMI